MSLITCPECCKPISEYAQLCPKCGVAITRSIAKMQKQKADRAAAIGFFGFAGFVAFLGVCWIAGTARESLTRERPSSVQSVSDVQSKGQTKYVSRRAETTGYKLATIDNGSRVDADDWRVSRFDSLVGRIANVTGDSHERIGDLCVAAHEMLSRRGYETTLLAVMEKADYLFEPRLKISAREIFALIVTLWDK